MRNELNEINQKINNQQETIKKMKEKINILEPTINELNQMNQKQQETINNQNESIIENKKTCKIVCEQIYEIVKNQYNHSILNKADLHQNNEILKNDENKFEIKNMLEENNIEIKNVLIEKRNDKIRKIIIEEIKNPIWLEKLLKEKKIGEAYFDESQLF